MSVEIKEGEVVPDTELVKSSDISSMVKEADKPLLGIMQSMTSMNWRELTPPQLAVLIMQKPFTANGGTMYLSFKQAILFATRCFELGVSPFSSEVWFDPNRASVNLTTEGRKVVARNKGLDLGPPQFEDLERSWDVIPRVTPLVEELKKLGFTKDVGIKCRIRVGNHQPVEYAEYLCWLSDWYVPKSPVWQAKYLHMLQVRATDKCLTMAMGTGLSEMIPDHE